MVESRLEGLQDCNDYIPPLASSFLDALSRKRIVVATAIVYKRNETVEMGNYVEPFTDQVPWTVYELASALTIFLSAGYCDMGCVTLMYSIRGRPGAQDETASRIHTKVSESGNGPPILVRAYFLVGHYFPIPPTLQALSLLFFQIYKQHGTIVPV